MKLYKITCRGMTETLTATGTAWGTAYVVAENPHIAYMKVREHLDKLGAGFECQRELKTIELLADDYVYPDCKIKLYL